MSVMPQSSPAQCEHHRLSNGIDEFRFLNNSRVAVDTYFALLSAYVMALPHSDADTPRLLIVLPPGMPPVSYMMERYRHFVRANQGHLPSTRVVYLYQSGFMLSMVRAFLGLISERKHPNRRFFPAHERAQAEAWLLEAKP